MKKKKNKKNIMFQDTLLIIKPDYLAKRKALLLHLLQQGFFIKGQRKICFSPELAAEFYQDLAEDRGFMIQVILLSKGNSEAFILAKECAVEDLINDMVCYFNTSTEMEQNIHVTKCLANVRREISYIFPNYIHEPIYCPEQIKFCDNNPLVESTINTLYDIVTNSAKDPHKSWKEKLAESLISTNTTLPHISNQCCHNLNLNAQDTAQQTKITCFKHEKVERKGSLSSDLDISRDCSSLNVTTSSCVSCSAFDSDADCIQQTFEQPFTAIIKARTASLKVQESSSSSTLKSEQEGALEDWITEEHTVGVVVNEIEEDKIVDEDFKDGADKDNFVALDVPTTEHMEANEMPEMESLQSTKPEENAIHVADEDTNQQAEEDNLQSPKENAVSTVDDEQSGGEFSAPIKENDHDAAEDVIPTI
ncbi:uncharacterized protein LOC119607214 [Lucilia sericata]|uniref:uncharacterized protein LOC119607214 n=1 Tax=Lucilia sericata TaxID=13632 RepID=UPI0018A84908|nr:uncharacterized protein LOC119607214 [Lucilia sericata]